MLIVLSGVSGSGKNTVIENLMKVKTDLKVFKSATTRKPRPNEIKRDIYVFLSKEDFLEKAKNGEFFEYEKVHDNFYGILKSQLDIVKENKNVDYIRDIDVNGNRSLKKHFNNKEILSIFLDAPNEILKDRLIKRGENQESIELRLSRAEMERSFKNEYDIVINNIYLNETLNLILKEIEKRKNSF